MVQFIQGKTKAFNIDIDASMSTDEVTPAQQAVILSGRDNWDKWYALIIASVKINHLIWKFVDLEKTEEMYPEEPARPLKNNDTPLGEYELELRLYLIDKDRYDK